MSSYLLSITTPNGEMKTATVTLGEVGLVKNYFSARIIGFDRKYAESCP